MIPMYAVKWRKKEIYRSGKTKVCEWNKKFWQFKAGLRGVYVAGFFNPYLMTFVKKMNLQSKILL